MNNRSAINLIEEYKEKGIFDSMDLAIVFLANYLHDDDSITVKELKEIMRLYKEI